MSDIRRVFLNVSMGKRHDGLMSVAKAAGIKVQELAPTDYLVFVNTSRDKVALLVGPQDPKTIQPMAYFRVGHTIDLNVIKHLPRHFNGRSLDFKAAMKDALEEQLKRRAQRPSVVAV